MEKKGTHVLSQVRRDAKEGSGMYTLLNLHLAHEYYPPNFKTMSKKKINTDSYEHFKIAEGYHYFLGSYYNFK